MNHSFSAILKIYIYIDFLEKKSKKTKKEENMRISNLD